MLDVPLGTKNTRTKPEGLQALGRAFQSGGRPLAATLSAATLSAATRMVRGPRVLAWAAGLYEARFTGSRTIRFLGFQLLGASRPEAKREGRAAPVTTLRSVPVRNFARKRRQDVHLHHLDAEVFRVRRRSVQNPHQDAGVQLVEKTKYHLI